MTGSWQDAVCSGNGTKYVKYSVSNVRVRVKAASNPAQVGNEYKFEGNPTFKANDQANGTLVSTAKPETWSEVLLLADDKNQKTCESSLGVVREK